VPGMRLAAAGRIVRPLGWLGLAAIAGSCVGLSSGAVSPRGALLIPALGTSAVLISGAAKLTGSVDLALSLPLLRSLGKYSYSWYLWHWPILMLAEARFSTTLWYGRVLCAALAFGLAMLSTRWIEDPIRFHRRLVERAAWSVGLAAVLSVGGIVMSGVWGRLVQRSEQFKVFVRPIGDLPRFYRLGCYTPFLDTRVRDCVFGDHDSSTAVVLLGDSHAAQWFPALERISNENHWRLVTMIKPACPAIFLRVVEGEVGSQERQCAAWRAAAIQRIGEIGARAVIVATSTRYPHISGQEWFDATSMLARRLTAFGVRTLFLRDTPSAGFEVPLCLARVAWRGSGDCNLTRSQALEETVFGIEQTVAKRLPFVWSIDLSDRICGRQRCEVVQDGRIILRDGDHLTASYVESLAPALAAQIVPLISADGPA
jgi:hypothetical protein